MLTDAELGSFTMRWSVIVDVVIVEMPEVDPDKR